jgi:hypothetical protein
MANFCNLFENMDYQKKLKEEQIDRKALEAVHKGLDLDENFWRNFLTLVNNSDAFGALLNVKEEKVSDWRKRITKYLTKFYEKEDTDLSKKSKFVKVNDYKKFM